MALPDGIKLVTVMIGPPLDFSGTLIPDGSLTIKPSTSLVHLATGTPIFAVPQTVPFDENGMAAFQLPATDQAGFSDGKGNALTNWTYEVTWSFKDKTVPTPASVNINLPAATPVVDLDLLVPVKGSAGVTVATPAVTSVNGMTGAVVIPTGGGTSVAGVTSVNGKTGDVTLAIPTVPVTSVNGKTGDVTVTVPVTSVNGKTGDVTIAAGSGGIAQSDVGTYWQVTRRPYQIAGLTAGADNTAAIANAIANAAAYDTLILPPGDWTHSSEIQHAKADVTVEGYGARLLATVPAHAAYRITGARAAVRGITHEVIGVTARGTGNNTSTCPFIIDTAIDVTLEDVHSIGSLDTAFFLFAATRARLRNLVGRDSFADGLHVTYGSTDCVIDGYSMTNPGDDGLAVVSYQGDAAICSNIRASRVRITNGQARGVSIVGGKRIYYDDVNIYRTRASAIYVANEAGATISKPVTTARISGGSVIDGNWDSNIDTGQIAVSNLLSGSLLSDVVIEGFKVQGNRKFATGESYCKVGTSNGSGGRMVGVTLQDLWMYGSTSTSSPGWVFVDGVNTATVNNGSYQYETGSGTGVTTNTEGYTVSGTTNVTAPTTTTAAPGVTVSRVRVGPIY